MRVISGRLGGRPLQAPSGNATRPTSDRVREALFAMLGDIAGASVLDLYAGSGALGIEALSRGAERATFVEARSAALSVLRKNVAALGLEGLATIVARPVGRALRAIGSQAPFDLIFADPPWPEIQNALAEILRIMAAHALAPEGRLLVEHSAREELNLPRGSALIKVDERAWGDTAVSFFTSEFARQSGDFF